MMKLETEMQLHAGPLGSGSHIAKHATQGEDLRTQKLRPASS